MSMFVRESKNELIPVPKIQMHLLDPYSDRVVPGGETLFYFMHPYLLACTTFRHRSER